MTDRQLINLAEQASRNAYVPYSHFAVGAALECRDGTVFTGCNIENAALGSTICAERTAACKAVSEGHRDFVRVAIWGEGKDYCITDDEDALTQVCRQYVYRGQCPRTMNMEKVYGRKQHVADIAREYHADGILYEQIKFCDPWAYERMLGSHILNDDYGYPVLSVDRPYNIASSGQMRTRVQAFVESMEIKKIQGGKQ